MLVFPFSTIHFRDHIPILFPNEILLNVGHFSDLYKVGLAFGWRKLQITEAFSHPNMLVKGLGVFELGIGMFLLKIIKQTYMNGIEQKIIILG
jgi:hypothetical protein